MGSLPPIQKIIILMAIIHHITFLLRSHVTINYCIVFPITQWTYITIPYKPNHYFLQWLLPTKLELLMYTGQTNETVVLEVFWID